MVCSAGSNDSDYNHFPGYEIEVESNEDNPGPEEHESECEDASGPHADSTASDEWVT